MQTKSKKDSKANEIKGLYLVTDRSLCTHHKLEEIVRLSALGGVQIVQLREKEITSREFLELAIKMVQLLEPLEVPLIINDRLDITLASGAAGIHLGQTDLPYQDARRILGPESIIGLSMETKEDFLELPPNYPKDLDYLAASPVFATTTKTNTKAPWGLEGLNWLSTKSQIPVVAIGGINLENAREVYEAGADSLAVVSYLCSAKDPKKSAQELAKIWT